KRKLKSESNELVSATHGFKFTAVDGKERLSDTLDIAGIVELTKNFPNTKAMKFLDWFLYSDTTLDGQSKKKGYTHRTCPWNQGRFFSSIHLAIYLVLEWISCPKIFPIRFWERWSSNLSSKWAKCVFNASRWIRLSKCSRTSSSPWDWAFSHFSRFWYSSTACWTKTSPSSSTAPFQGSFPFMPSDPIEVVTEGIPCNMA